MTQANYYSSRSSTSEGSLSARSGRASFQGMTRSISTAVSRRSVVGNGNVSLPQPSRRPVTGAGGLARQKTASAVPAKSVGFYSNLLQQKQEEILKEIQRLENETDFDVRKKVESEHSNAVKEVQRLETAIGDFNLAKDKSRSGANHEDIHEEVVELCNRIKTLENEIDNIFVSRKRIESQILKQDAIENKFADNPEMLYKYKMINDLVKSGHTKEIEEKAKLDEVEAEIKALEGSSRYKQVKGRVDDLEQQIARVENDLELLHLTDEHEARLVLLEKLKRLDKEQLRVDKKSNAIQLEIDSMLEKQSRLQSQLRVKTYEPKEGPTELDILHSKFNERKHFLADSNVKAHLQLENTRLTEAIGCLEQDLEKMRNAGLSLQLPSQEELGIMKDEVDFTSNHLDQNKSTIGHLQYQKRAREVELEKIISLEDKIHAEHKEIDAKTYEMKEEMGGFKTAEELRALADETRNNLVDSTEVCTQRIEELKAQLKEATAEREQLKQTLEKNPNWKTIEHLMTKMREEDSEINNLEKEIDEMKAETAYEEAKAKCLDLVDKINKKLVSKQ